MKRVTAILLALVMLLTLSACGHKHTWKDATCTEPKTCDCGETSGEALGHDWGEPSYDWAEDLSSVTATRVCRRDASHVETETAAVESETTKAASCEEPGETVYTAAFANEAFAPQTRTEAEPPAAGHAWTGAEYEWAEDMSSVTATRVCGNDPSHVETEIAEVTAEQTKAASCEEPGETTYSVVFGNPAFEPQTRVEADVEPTGHEWGEPSFDWAEDMSSVTVTRVCENDPSHVETETAEVTAEVVREPDCDEPGEIVYTAAGFQDESLPAAENVSAALDPVGHEWGEPSYEWAEDLSSVTATRVCLSDSSHVESETAETGTTVNTDPTCEGTGETIYTAVFENPAFEPQVRLEADIEPLGHDWGEVSYDWAEDLSTVTAARVCATDPAHVETETAAVTAEVTKAPTCETAGETTYTAVFTNAAFAAQSRTESDLEPLGHDWGEPSYAWAEDLSSITATRVCLHDPAHVESETVAVTAETTKAPSCLDKGETTYTAVFANAAFAGQSRTEVDVEPLGHSWEKATHTVPQTCSVCGETEGEPLPIHYFNMSFQEYRRLFNNSYPGFLNIDTHNSKGFVLKVKGETMRTYGLDSSIRFYHADEFYPGSASSTKALKQFNLIRIRFDDNSGKFDTSLSGRIAQLGYYAAKVLDPTVSMDDFFKLGLDLFHAKGATQSFIRNGYVYTLSCEQLSSSSYRYEFSITLEENLE